MQSNGLGVCKQIPLPSVTQFTRKYDECVPPKTTTLLRKAGFDTVWADHVSRQSLDDPDHLVYAYEMGIRLLPKIGMIFKYFTGYGRS